MRNIITQEKKLSQNHFIENEGTVVIGDFANYFQNQDRTGDEFDYRRYESILNKINFLNVLREDFEDEDDIEDFNKKSLENARQFLSKMPGNLKMPDYDLHPDGEISFVWRNDEKGILTLAFAENGDINYASYFVKNNTRHKGVINQNNLKFASLDDPNSSMDDKILFSLIKEFS